MTSLRDIASSIFSNWFALLITVLISFFLAPYVVNSLGDVYYGIWAVMMQFTGYLYLMDFGLRDSLIKNVAKYRIRGNREAFSMTVSVVFYIYIATAVATMLVVLVLACIVNEVLSIPVEHSREAFVVILLSGFTIAQTFLFNVFTGTLMGLQRYVQVNAVGIFVSFVRALLIVLALSHGYKIVALAMIHVLTGVLAGLLNTILAVRALDQANLPFSLARVSYRSFRRRAGPLMGFSTFVFINNIGQKVVFATDALVIAIFLPISAVTPYAIAGSLVNYLKSLLAVTTMIFNPLASELRAGRKTESVRHLLVHGSRLSLFVTLPVVMTYIFSGDDFIRLWMGEKYGESSGLILSILGFAHLAAIPSHTMISMLYGVSKHAPLAYIRIGEAIANLVLSLILVQSHGLIGVAVGTLIPHVIVAGVIIPVYTARVVGISVPAFYLQSWIRPLINVIPFVVGLLVFSTYYRSKTLAGFFIQILCLLIAYAFSGLFVILDSNERARGSSAVSALRGRLVNKRSV